MRDEATAEKILALVRALMLRDPGVTFGQLIHATAKYAVPGSDVLNISDDAMLRALRARCYRNRLRPMVDGKVSVEHLAALDEVWDEKNIHADGWLRKELEMIKGWLLRGVELTIADDNKELRLRSLSEFDAWWQERYPVVVFENPKGE